MVGAALIGATMATSVSLTGPFCRCANTEPVVVGSPTFLASRSYLNLQQGRNQLRLQNVAGLWQRTSGSRRIIIKAMAEDSSESAVTTEDRAMSPEEEEDQANISEIFRVLDLLKQKRDMPFNEVRLTVMIEDPQEVARRRELGIESERGCSKEDLAAALQEVYDGKVPEDRIVLRELTKEMLNWPNLEDEIDEVNPLASPYAKVTPTGVDPKVAAERAKVDWDAGAEIEPVEKPKSFSDMVPPVVGFSFLYLVSFFPVIIVIAVILILFFSSLQ